VFLDLVVRDRGWVVKAQLVVQTSAIGLDGKNFFLNSDLRLDIVVASEDIGSFDVDAQVVDLVGVVLKVCQKQAPVGKRWLERLMCAEKSSLTYQTSSSQSPKFVELTTILR